MRKKACQSLVTVLRGLETFLHALDPCKPRQKESVFYLAAGLGCVWMSSHAYQLLESRPSLWGISTRTTYKVAAGFLTLALTFLLSRLRAWSESSPNLQTPFSLDRMFPANASRDHSKPHQVEGRDMQGMPSLLWLTPPAAPLSASNETYLFLLGPPSSLTAPL
eukprot:g25925.t1